MERPRDRTRESANPCRISGQCNLPPIAPAQPTIHFHGGGNSVTGTLNHFPVIEQIVERRKSAVLAVPKGPHNSSDLSGGKLEDADGFKRFVGEVMATLRARGVLTRRAPDCRATSLVNWTMGRNSH